MSRIFVLGVCFFIFSGNLVHAQDSASKRIDFYLSHMDMRFSMPRNYIARKSDFYFGCNALLSPPIHYTIINKERSILIGFYFGGPVSLLNLNRAREAAESFGKSFDVDSIYIQGVQNLADTSNYKIIRLSRKFVTSNYNGDHGIEYVRNCTTPMYYVDDHGKCSILTEYYFLKDTTRKILETYNHNKIVSISKDGLGHVEFIYLYTDAVSENEIKKEIIKTAKMLRFD